MAGRERLIVNDNMKNIHAYFDDPGFFHPSFSRVKLKQNIHCNVQYPLPVLFQ